MQMQHCHIMESFLGYSFMRVLVVPVLYLALTGTYFSGNKHNDAQALLAMILMPVLVLVSY